MSSALASLDVAPVTRLFKALSDETRVRIVALLSHGELCVCHVESALRLSQPKASRHLAVLRSAGVVRARRSGSWMHYRLADQADPRCRAQLAAVVAAYAKAPQLKRDLARLVEKKGPRACD